MPLSIVYRSLAYSSLSVSRLSNIARFFSLIIGAKSVLTYSSSFSSFPSSRLILGFSTNLCYSSLEDLLLLAPSRFSIRVLVCPISYIIIVILGLLL